jgi:RNA polymerase sigma factor (sigma-70 family)
MPPQSPYGARVSERWLLAAARRGDRRATDALLRRYDRRVLTIVRGLRLPHGVDTHDVAQAARLGALGAIRTWRPGGSSLANYVKTCARRRAITAINDARSSRRISLAAAASLDVMVETGREIRCVGHGAPAQGDPLAHVLALEQLTAMAAALPTLTPKERFCLQGELNGRSYTELAAAIDGTTRAVATAVARARRKLAAAAAAAAA